MRYASTLLAVLLAVALCPAFAAAQDDSPGMKTATGVKKHTGMGGEVEYAEAGVLELGGSAGFAITDDFTTISASPSVGMFVTDYVEVSAIANFAYFDINDETSWLLTPILEPSVHVPIAEDLYGFVGAGAGLAIADDIDTSFALRPRAGLDIKVGRSGIFRPAVSFLWQTDDGVQTGGTVLPNEDILWTADLGYTVIW